MIVIISAMVTLLLARNVAAQTGYGTQSTTAQTTKSTTTATTTTTTPVTCQAAPKTYPNLSGEDLYKQFLADLSASEVEINGVVNANSYAPASVTSGAFFSSLTSVNSANVKLQSLLNGAVLTGSDCLTFVKSLASAIQNVQSHANDIIPGACDSLTGEAKHQYTLQKLGAALSTLTQLGQTHQNDNAYMGPQLSVVVGLFNAMTNVQNVVTYNDTAGCAAAALQIANSLKGILGAGNGVLS